MGEEHLKKHPGGGGACSGGTRGVVALGAAVYPAVGVFGAAELMVLFLSALRIFITGHI